MTEIKEPTVEEQIAERLRYWDGYDIDGQTKEEKYASIIKFILAIPKIKEGLELLEKADKLVELDTSRPKFDRGNYYHYTAHHVERAAYDAGQEDMRDAGYRHVKPLASGESR